MNYRLPDNIGYIIQIIGTAWSLETAVKDIVRKATLLIFWFCFLEDCSSKKYPDWGISKATNFKGKYEVDHEAKLEFLKRYKICWTPNELGQGVKQGM